jgi:hypothetical protein
VIFKITYSRGPSETTVFIGEEEFPDFVARAIALPPVITIIFERTV